MVNNKTYNNVVNTLLRLGEYHAQISTTSVGDIFDVDLEKNTKFPLMHITPVNVATGDSTLTYNFQILVMSMTGQKSDWTANRSGLQGDATETDNGKDFEKLYKTYTDEQSVYSECLQICVDLVSLLRHSKWQSLGANPAFEYAGTNDINEGIYFTEGQYTFEPFAERFDNLCVGYTFNIGVLVHNNFQACQSRISCKCCYRRFYFDI